MSDGRVFDDQQIRGLNRHGHVAVVERRAASGNGPDTRQRTDDGIGHQQQVETRGRALSAGIIEFEASIAISNVMFVCPVCNEPSRIGILRDGKEVQRVCKKCKAEFD